jgi:hypothetical protein
MWIVAEEVHFRLSAILLERLDAISAAWDTSRSGAIRRLIELADVEGAGSPLEPPTLEEMLQVAGERARRGNVAAMNFCMAHLPDEREQQFQRLLQRLGAGDQ